MGQALPKPVTSTICERHASINFRVGVSELNGWRASNEDAHLIYTHGDWGFFGVFDGHGGQTCSEWIARRLREYLVADGCPKNDAESKELMLKMDKEYLESEAPSGSTGTMCIVEVPQGCERPRLRVINVGDSRVLLGRRDGTIFPGPGTDEGLTTDHKPDHPDEKDRIYRCGGFVSEAGGVARVNGDLAVSRGFGDREYKKTGGERMEDRPVTADPELAEFTCDFADFLLLVCDGVSEGDFPNAEVVQFVADQLRDHGDPGAAARAVCHKAVAQDSKDNITCMVVLLDGVKGEGAEGTTQSEFQAGPATSLGDRGFRSAYEHMAQKAGFSLVQAVDQRYEHVKQQLPSNPELQEEADKFGEAAGTPGSDERAAWIENWIECLQDDDGGPGKGPYEDLISRIMESKEHVENMERDKAASAAAAAEPYTWRQKDEEIQISFKLSRPSSKNDVKVLFTMSALQVVVHGEPLLDSCLSGKVDVEECTWSLPTSMELQVILTKIDGTEYWSSLLK